MRQLSEITLELFLRFCSQVEVTVWSCTPFHETALLVLILGHTLHVRKWQVEVLA